jgi:SPX domain protein involved in polyphosphate accumulation
MSAFETRFERLELKYLIDEVTADRVRRDIAPYCNADEHNDASRKQPGYTISSLYLDSPGLAFHCAKERGDSERLKLRIRSYAGAPFAVLEQKRKVSDIIDKTRASVPRSQVERAAQGLYTGKEEPLEVRNFLRKFAIVAATSGAQPTLHVSYQREAFMSAVDSYARVTFDRDIVAQRTNDWALDGDPSNWCAFNHNWRPDLRERNIVLELKCESSIPFWMSDLVRKNSLESQSFSKYSIGIRITGRQAGEGLVPRRSSKVMIA